VGAAGGLGDGPACPSPCFARKPWAPNPQNPTPQRLLYLERRRLDDAAYNQGEPRLSGVRPVVYVARATLDNARLIAWQIKATPRWGALRLRAALEGRGEGAEGRAPWGAARGRR
jgi:hypothetical protein